MRWKETREFMKDMRKYLAEMGALGTRGENENG